MYGCRLPESFDVYGEESGGPDLISEFQEVIGWKYESDFRPDIASLAETAKASETWERFVAWCKERQIELPAADLWIIVTTETA